MKKWLYYLLGWVLPERLIRALFMSSLYSKLFNNQTLDVRVYSRVNKLLNICESDYACGVGMQLAQSFWNDDEVKHISVMFNDNHQLVLTPDAEKMIVNKIIEATPKWLRYGLADMKDDVSRLIRKRVELENIASIASAT